MPDISLYVVNIQIGLDWVSENGPMSNSGLEEHQFKTHRKIFGGQERRPGCSVL